MTSPYTADLWYRAADDPDRSIRPGCQMIMPCTDEQDLDRELASLRAQGYTVQRAIMRTTCPTCAGHGQITIRPKGMRRTTAAKLPSWRLLHRTCPTCQGDGWIDSADFGGER